MDEMIDNYYEANQMATKGPVLVAHWEITWQDHFKTLGILCIIFLVGFVTTWLVLTALYHFNPGYGIDIEMEKAFCLEINEQFVSSQYEWSEDDLICKRVGPEVSRED